MSLLDSARDHLRQLLGVIQTRLELIGLELTDARDHLVGLLACAAAAVFFAGVTVITALAWLIMAYWEERLMIIGGATVLFAVLTVIAIWRATRHAESGGDIFADSLMALQTDRAALRPLPASPPEQSRSNDTGNYVGD